MPAPTANAQLDGISVITKGMNGGSAPRLLPPDQLFNAINVTCRGGLPRTRPVWKKVALVYPDAATETAATEALFQGASYYQAFDNGENCLIASIGGRIFRYLVGSTRVVQDISLADLNSSVEPQTWMWQSEDFLIIQNGQALPLFFDGASLRRSAGPGGQELPAGCMGAYVQGRNWVTLTDRTSYIGSDLVYSYGIGGPYNGRDAVLGTRENTMISGGGAFTVPVTAGKINAMTSVAISDTSLGQGPLQVMTQTCVFSVQVPLLREEWAVVEYPLITIGLPNYGALSQWSTVPVNGDVWYRAFDGLRSYQIARRDFNTWVNAPLSEEVGNYIDLDNVALLGHSSAVIFNNRYLVTCSPRRAEGRGIAHRGLIAMDFHNISGIGERGTGIPAYDGLWTGLPILQILKGTFNRMERCFAFALDIDGNICLYELLTDLQGKFDWDGSGEVSVESSLESRAMGWRDNGNVLKRLICGDLYLDALSGNDEIDFEFTYRSDEHPIWQDWHSFSLCAPNKNCATEDCPTFQDVRTQYRTFIRLPQPADICSEITKRYLRTAYEFQVRMKWTGYAQLNRFHAWAEPMKDSVVTACPGSETCTLLEGCEPDPFSYSIET